MQFLNPWGLIAFGGALLPFLLYLWNNRPKKILKIGSLARIEDASPQNTLQNFLRLMPKGLVLLLIRGLIFAILALILAGASLATYPKNSPRGYILIPKNLAPQAYHFYPKEIDSLLDIGFEGHSLDSAFSLIPLKDFHKTVSRNLSTLEKDNYWDDLFYLESKLENKFQKNQKEVKIFVFTDALQSHFMGDVPSIKLPIRWQVFPLKIAKKDTPRSESILKASKKFKKTIRMAIIFEERSQDAFYLASAIRTIEPYLQAKVTLTLETDLRKSRLPASKYDWIFWLKDTPFPTQYLNTTSTLFEYKIGNSYSTNTWMLSEYSPPANPPFIIQNTNLSPIIIHKVTEAASNYPINSNPVFILLRDGYNRPILSLHKTPTLNSYQFYTHFNPNWNDLVWNDHFPIWMLNLLSDPISNPKKTTLFGNFNIPNTPNVSKKRFEVKDRKNTPEFLNEFLGILLLIAFGVERIVSHHKAK